MSKQNAVLIRVAALFVACFLTLPFVGPSALAATPSSGTLTDGNPTVTYTGGPYAVSNATDQANGNAYPTCDPIIPAEQCDMFTLTVNVAPGDLSTKQIRITISWSPVTAADYDLFVYSGPYQNSAGNVIASNPSGVDPAVVVIPAVSGTYTIVLDPFNPAGDTFVGTIALEPKPVASQQGSGTPPRYQTYAAPPSAGGANKSGEPSIGVDWNPNVHSLRHGTVNPGGVTFFTSNLNEFRVSFDDCSSPAIQTWTDITSPVETVASLDPIGFCDHLGPMPSPGRLFQAQLAAATSLTAFSDDDGNTWTQSQGSGLPAGPDHQSLGAGPYNHNSTPPAPPHPLYPNALYYCSQAVAAAFCSRSDNGGQTFGPGVPIYNTSQCGGLHGHVKVAPDGTVYVPNRGCGSNQGVAVSTDNGLTWVVRHIPDSIAGNTDPSVGIAMDGTVYFGYQDGSNHARIAVTHDQGLTWAPSVDAGAPFNIQNSVFPEVVAGDGNRAAFMFLGTPTGGNYQDTAGFTGIWHAYIATTFDGGLTYITVDATPVDPVQVGSICTAGTTCGADRNLLDFNDLSVDSQGRVLGGFADGCVIGSCDASSPSGASRSALGTIIRQSGGPRLFAAFDPVEPAVPGAPQLVSAVRQSNGVLLTWLEPDNGGSPIIAYNIYRGTVSGGESPFTSVGPVKTSYLDTSALPNTNYFYRVAAVNSVGIGPLCGEVSVVAGQALQSPCTLPGLTVVKDPTGDQTGAPANTQLDIQSISIAEPFVSLSDPNKLTFTMKVQELNSTPVPQPNSQWTIYFTAPNGQEYFVDMNTNTPPTPVFEYGHTTTLPTGGKNLVTDGTADSGTFLPDGTIRIVLADSKPAPTDGTHALNLNPGDQLVNINGQTQTLVGAGPLGGLLITVDSTSAGRYVLVGNQSCSH
jgi:hypothetical protein